MTIPATADIQFVPGSGKLFVDSLQDPSGNPVTVLDIDAGFVFAGRVELPGWLSGQGVVRLTADEIGGPIDQTIGEASFSVNGASTPNDPPTVTYRWSITVQSPTLPDESKMYQFGVMFFLKTSAGGHTDIGGFFDLGAYMVV